MSASKRIPELDSLRGIAALAVMLYHFTVRFSNKFKTDIISDFFVFDYGMYGVELFFTISGFVIYMSIEKISEPIEFVYKRFIRLYPTFWACLIITYIIIELIGPEILRVSSMDFIANFTMLPSLFGGRSVDGVYWTLKDEMFFYLFILLLMMFNWLSIVKYIGFGYFAVGICLLILSKIITTYNPEQLINYYYYGILFLIGINFFRILNDGLCSWNFLQLIGSVFMAGAISSEKLAVVLAIILIFTLLINKYLYFLAVPPLLFLGKISYALYLLHQNIGYTIQINLIKLHINNYIVLIITPIVFSIILAWIVTNLIEAFLNTGPKKWLSKVILSKHS